MLTSTSSDLTASRIDLFTTVHKGLRWQMGRVMAALGSAQFSSPTGAAAVEELELFLKTIDQHTRHEDELIAPLLKLHSSDKFVAWQTEHRELEAFEAKLHRQIQDVRDSERSDPMIESKGLALYRAFARFAGAMLEHLDLEETTLMPLLWHTCSDEDIGGVMSRFLRTYGADAAQQHRQFSAAYTPAEKVKLGL